MFSLGLKKKTLRPFSRCPPAVLPVEILDSGTRHLSKKFTKIYPSFLGDRETSGSHTPKPHMVRFRAMTANRGCKSPWIPCHDPYSADRRRHRIGLTAPRVPDSGWVLRHHGERRRAGCCRGVVRWIRNRCARRDDAAAERPRCAASHSAREHAAGVDADGAG